jgi:hypothetical protein
MRLGLTQLRQPPAQMVGLRLAQVEREGLLVGVASRVGLAEPMQQLGSGRMPPGVRREAVDRVDESQTGVASTRVPSSRTRVATASPASIVGCGHDPKSMTGRTSTAPVQAAGILAAVWIASSRSAHSRR